MTPFDSAQGKHVKENRELIATELDQTLIVEAAAGTGKTTELVRRIVALIANQRATIGQIVAVTFSEKAAGELKLRLREELERARETTAPDSDAGRLLDAAVHDFEEAQVSTIHGFCAELLRERPVEARVDPAFVVLTDTQAERVFEEAFSSWLHGELGNPQEGVRRSLRRPVKWRFGDETEDGPIERLRAAARNLREWRDHPAPWRRPSYDRTSAIKANMGFLEKLVLDPNEVKELLALDLLAHVRRRAEMDRDAERALVTLIRALEAFAQYQLFKQHQIKSWDVSVDALPQALQETCRTCHLSDLDGKYKLPLHEQFRALAGLGHPMGQTFLAQWAKMKPLLDAAHQAVLGHGFEPVKAERVHQLYEIVVKVTGVSDTSLPRFPVLNL